MNGTDRAVSPAIVQDVILRGMNCNPPSIVLCRMSLQDAAEIVAHVVHPQADLVPWVFPPTTILAFKAWYQRHDNERAWPMVIRTQQGAFVGVVTIMEIVRGNFLSGYLGYWGHAPMLGRGLMREAVGLAVDLGFSKLGLHRLEANIQPENNRSRALLRGLGFRLEGFSPRYLRIGQAWRDHERWALTVEERPCS